MSYRVIAPLVLAHGRPTAEHPVGHVNYHYAGSYIAWLNDEEATRLVAEGFVVEVDAAAPAAAPSDSAPANAPATGAPKPPQIATDDALREWLLARSDTGHSPEEIAKLGHDDLRALVDAL